MNVRLVARSRTRAIEQAFRANDLDGEVIGTYADDLSRLSYRRPRRKLLAHRALRSGPRRSVLLIRRTGSIWGGFAPGGG